MFQLYFSNTSSIFTTTRPYEALFRDPWWLFTACNLLYNIKTKYEFGLLELIRVSPRFGVLLSALLLSVAFIILDILSVTHVIPSGALPDGINPFWKLSFVFKCLTDTIVLDDFKSALDRLKRYKMERMGSVLSDGLRGDFVDVEQAQKRKKAEREAREAFREQQLSLQSDESHKSHDFGVGKGSRGSVGAGGMLDLEAALHMDDLWREGGSGSSASGKPAESGNGG